jgi:hypothetical protein
MPKPLPPNLSCAGANPVAAISPRKPSLARAEQPLFPRLTAGNDRATGILISGLGEGLSSKNASEHAKITPNPKTTMALRTGDFMIHEIMAHSHFHLFLCRSPDFDRRHDPCSPF